eukprot:bmy_15217T0
MDLISSGPRPGVPPGAWTEQAHVPSGGRHVPLRTETTHKVFSRIMSIKQEKITNQPENQVNTRRNKDNKNRPMKTSVIYLDYQTQIIINYVYFIYLREIPVKDQDL